MKKNIAILQFITLDNAALNYIAQAEEACRGGIRWVQLRVKNQADDQWNKTAREMKNVTRQYGAQLIVNDSVQIARETEADGVHLGRHDMDPVLAREILGEKYIIGGTANNEQEALALARAGVVDYIGIGPYRFTSTKANLSPVLGIHQMGHIARRLKTEGFNIPLIAIGGIQADDIKKIASHGLHGVALSSAIACSDNPAETAAAFVKESKKYFT